MNPLVMVSAATFAAMKIPLAVATGHTHGVRLKGGTTCR